MKNLTAWGCYLKGIDDKEDGYIDFISLDVREVEKHIRENWDPDAVLIVRLQIKYNIYEKTSH